MIAELINFSGYFNFKNISFKFLHSCERKSCVDDKRFARSNIVLNTGAPNDGIFPNASEVSEMYHSVLGKPV